MKKQKSKSILSISYDDIVLRAREKKVTLTEEQVDEIFERFDVNDVMMEGFWLLMDDMIEEKSKEQNNA